MLFTLVGTDVGEQGSTLGRRVELRHNGTALTTQHLATANHSRFLSHESNEKM